MLITQNLRDITAILLCTLLFQNCYSRLNALEDGTSSQEPFRPVVDHQPVTGNILTTMPNGRLLPVPSPRIHLSSFTTPTAPRKQQKAFSPTSIEKKNYLGHTRKV